MRSKYFSMLISIILKFVQIHILQNKSRKRSSLEISISVLLINKCSGLCFKIWLPFCLKSILAPSVLFKVLFIQPLFLSSLVDIAPAFTFHAIVNNFLYIGISDILDQLISCILQPSWHSSQAHVPFLEKKKNEFSYNWYVDLVQILKRKSLWIECLLPLG